MIVQAKTRLYFPCPFCKNGKYGGWRGDQLTLGFKTRWSCDDCQEEFNIERVNEEDFKVESTGKKNTPVTVTLRSVTEPPITLKLNSWKYAHSQDQEQGEYESNQRYFYDEHTCPTNWVSQIEQMEFKGDTDPHGVFEFVSVEDGHFVDPNVL